MFSATRTTLIETFFMVFFNGNFFRSSSSHVLKPQVNKQESCEFGAKIIAGSAFFVMRMLLTNPLRCLDMNRIRVDGRI